MVLTREQEIWGMAIWVEKQHAEGGHDYIEQRIASMEAAGDHDGARLWLQVGERYAQLRTGPIPIHGQPGTQLN